MKPKKWAIPSAHTREAIKDMCTFEVIWAAVYYEYYLKPAAYQSIAIMRCILVCYIYCC